LGSTATDYDSDGFGAGTFGEEVIPFGAELSFLEFAAFSENFFLNTMHSCLNLSTSRLTHGIKIPLGNTTRTENISISKVLSRQITNW